MFELGYRADGLPLNIPVKHLRTHAAIFGMTGSGKTGLGIVMLEEALVNGIPVLAFDVKGDIANLALKGSMEGRARALRDREVLILTPGSNAGLPISISGLLSMPATLSWERHEEILLEKISTIAEALLGLVYKGKKKDVEREKALIAAIIEYAWRNSEPLDIERLVTYLLDPPFRKIGVLQLENFYPLRERRKLAVEFNKLLSLPSFKLWRRGVAPDMDSLLWDEKGSPRAVVVYMAHLNERQRMFTVTLLLQQIYGWMFEKGSSNTLRALVFFDEIYGYLPPYPKNPPSKHLLMLLFKQARAFGIGMVISTQNPIDVDYKVLSNAGLWFIGKLKTANDRRRVLEGLSEEASFYDRARLEAEIASLKSREFLLVNSVDREIIKFRTRDAYSELRGPLTLEDIRALTGGSSQSPLPLETSFTPPMMPEEIPVYFLPSRHGCEGGVYRPLIYVKIYAKAVNRKLKLEKTFSTARFIYPEPLVKIEGMTRHAYCMDAERLEVSQLSHKWSRGIAFAQLPPEYLRKGIYRRLERKIKLLLATKGDGLATLYLHRGTGLLSNFEEGYEEFRERVKRELAKRAEVEKRKIVAEYKARERALRDRIMALQNEILQLQSRLEEMESLKARISSLFRGTEYESEKAALRIALSGSKEELRSTAEEVEKIKEELVEKLNEIDSVVAREADNIEEVPLKVKRNSINIELFLVWVPLVEKDGVIYNCFTGGSCEPGAAEKG